MNKHEQKGTSLRACRQKMDSTEDRSLQQTASRFVDSAIQYRMTTSRPMKASAMHIRQTMRIEAFKEGFGEDLRILTGSHFEAMPFEVCGDRDYMVLRRDFPVVRADGLTPEHHTTDPAYMKLSLSKDADDNLGDLYKPCVVNIGEVTYFSSDRFIEVIRHRYGDASSSPHGPAMESLAVPGHALYGQQDTVFCLSMDSWPLIAAPFFQRPRHHGWPSEESLDKARESECYVVAVGRKDDTERYLGWRLSFSLAERQLTYDMTDNMAGCLFALKAIKKKVWNEESEGMCSYFLKTACFWVFEENTLCAGDIPTLCEKVMDFLVQAYSRQTLPHYIIPEQNLLSAFSTDTCQDNLKRLVEIRQDLVPYIMWAVASIVPESKDSLLRAREFANLPVKTKYALKDYQELLYSTESKDALIRAMRVEEPHSPMFEKKQRVEYMFWSSNNALLPVIYAGKLGGLEPEYVYELICGQFEGTINQVKKLTFPNHSPTFITMLSRDFGEFLYAVAIYFINKSSLVDSNESKTLMGFSKKFSAKVEQLLRQGVELVLPDGWTDHGLSGLVALATYYHLHGDRAKFTDTVNQLKPLLDTLDMKEIKFLHHETIVENKDLSKDVWKNDEKLYEKLVVDAPEHYINIHCTSLGFYLLGLEAADDRETLDDIIHRMKGLDIYFHRDCFKRPNNVMIEILTTLP